MPPEVRVVDMMDNKEREGVGCDSSFLGPCLKKKGKKEKKKKTRERREITRRKNVSVGASRRVVFKERGVPTYIHTCSASGREGNTTRPY